MENRAGVAHTVFSYGEIITQEIFKVRPNISKKNNPMLIISLLS